MGFSLGVQDEQVLVPWTFQDDIARIDLYPIAIVLGSVFNRIGAAGAAILTIWYRV
jgi:hypothetical protein